MANIKAATVMPKCPDCRTAAQVYRANVAGVKAPAWQCGQCGIFFGEDRVEPPVLSSGKKRAIALRHLVMGVLIGASLTASLGLAGNLYDRSGSPAAPRGSIQSYDYFRSRQLQLDVGSMRRQADQQRGGVVPCQK